MKNRVLLLCLKMDNTMTVDQYANMIGVDYETARNILKEKIVLTDELIEKNCLLFDVSKEYLLCQE